MYEQIDDYRLQMHLKQYIDFLPMNQQIQLKNIKYCGTKIITPNNGAAYQSGVFVLGDKTNRDSKIFGAIMCKNRWCCPVCTPKIMRQVATDIACAIDALKEQNQSACMITFTVPHTYQMRLLSTMKILNSAWQKMTRRIYQTKKGKYKKSAYCNMLIEQNSIHHVKVAEITFGDSGWHPHYHCLFWFPNDNWDKILPYEQAVQAEWREHLKSAMLEYYQSHDDELKYFNLPKRDNANESNAEFFVRRLFEKADWKSSPGLKFSVNKKGNLIKQQSSDYICGWGADKELTGNVQKSASHAGHRTPYQLLLDGALGDEFAMKKYIEMCLEISKMRTRRISWSIHSGIKKIICNWKKSKKFIETHKKKLSEKPKNYQVVCWFTREQWRRICHKNLFSPIIHNVLYLATLENGFKLIYDFLDSFGLKCESPATNISTKLVENLYNVAA